MPDIRYIEEENEKEKATEKKKKARIPYGHIQVNLDSVGKLYAPKTLHIRNFSIDELTDMGMVSANEDVLEVIVNCLRDMIHENFDPDYLTEEEIKQILFTLHSRWSGSISGVPFLFCEKEEEIEGMNKKLKLAYIEESGKRLRVIKGIDDKSNVGYADIDISNINTNSLNVDIEGPYINLKAPDGEKVTIKIATVGDLLEAKKYVENKYKAMERKFSDFKIKYDKYQNIMEEIKKADNDRVDFLLETLPELDDSALEEYEEYLKQKTSDMFKVMEACFIASYGGKKCQNLSEKLKVNKKLGKQFWTRYSNFIKENINYGIDPNVKFFCPELGDTITRRLEFRFMDFIQEVESNTDSGIEISFSKTI